MAILEPFLPIWLLRTINPEVRPPAKLLNLTSTYNFADITIIPEMAVGHSFHPGQSRLSDWHELFRQPVVHTGTVENGRVGHSTCRHICDHGQLLSARSVYTVVYRNICLVAYRMYRTNQK